jgi:hypothetical protein
MSTLLSLAEVPALPLHTAGKYVAGAYIVLFVLVLVYVSIMALRLSRIERNLGELLELSDLGTRDPDTARGGGTTQGAATARGVANKDSGAPDADLAERESTPA